MRTRSRACTRVSICAGISSLVASTIDRRYRYAYKPALFLACLLPTPLAITSTNAMMRRLRRRWQSLHRLIYVIAILGVWHYWWQVKKDIREPLLYAAILAALLGWRLWRRQRKATSMSALPRAPETT